MSFGGVAMPTPSSTGGGDDRPPSSNAPSTPVPPAPPHFSANFTFQGPPAPPPPPPPLRPYTSTTFSFPGPPMPSSAPPPPPPPRLPFASPSMFPYQSATSNLPQASSGGIPSYGAPVQTHLRPPSQSPISTQAPLPGTSAGQAAPQPLGIVPVAAQGHTGATMAQQLRPLPVQQPAVQSQGQTAQVPAIGGNISATQVPTSAGQLSTSAGAASTRPGPLPTPQYRAPFVANPALSLSSGDLSVSISHVFLPRGQRKGLPHGP